MDVEVLGVGGGLLDFGNFGLMLTMLIGFVCDWLIIYVNMGMADDVLFGNVCNWSREDSFCNWKCLECFGDWIDLSFCSADFDIWMPMLLLFYYF